MVYEIYERFIKTVDSYFDGHLERVSLYCNLIARSLSLPFKELKHIIIAGYLHDVGKLLLKKEILTKPGPLTEEEWRDVFLHPMGSVLLLKPFGVDKEVTDLIMLHHERVDGNGYPNGLLADRISLGGKIIAVADAYDSMTSGRCYKTAVTRFKANEELQRCAGTQFDNEIVRVFIKRVESLNPFKLK